MKARRFGDLSWKVGIPFTHVTPRARAGSLVAII